MACYYTNHKICCDKNGDTIYWQLQRLKSLGYIERVGVSICDPVELDKICSRCAIDAAQAPVNVFDNRIAESGGYTHLVKDFL